MSGAGHVDPSNKKVALLIAVLALLLAIAETLGNASQTLGLSKNIEASNLWSFFQAKSIRMTTLRTAADTLEAQQNLNERQTRLIERWREDARRYDSEPGTGEGRQELAARAKSAEAARDRALAAHHHYELASAVTQIGIVVASASIIVAIPALVWVGVGAGAVGVALVGVGFFAPAAVHIF